MHRLRTSQTPSGALVHLREGNVALLCADFSHNPYQTMFHMKTPNFGTFTTVKRFCIALVKLGWPKYHSLAQFWGHRWQIEDMYIVTQDNTIWSKQTSSSDLQTTVGLAYVCRQGKYWPTAVLSWSRLSRYQLGCRRLSTPQIRNKTPWTHKVWNRMFPCAC
jgi:hypothetical protein